MLIYVQLIVNYQVNVLINRIIIIKWKLLKSDLSFIYSKRSGKRYLLYTMFLLSIAACKCRKEGKKEGKKEGRKEGDPNPFI